MAMTMDANHVGMVTKDRTGKFQDQFIEKPGRKLGRELIAWLNEGAEPPPPPSKSVERRIHDAMVEIGDIMNRKSESGEKLFTDDEIKAVKAKLTFLLKNPPEVGLASISRLLDEQRDSLAKRIEFFESLAAGKSRDEEASCPDGLFEGGEYEAEPEKPRERASGEPSEADGDLYSSKGAME
jgi:hypothetical protein